MTQPVPRSAGGIFRSLPSSITGPEPQNPAPWNQVGQVDADRIRALADQIVTVFLNSLPSNYVSQTKGPYYVQQFQAAAEELARIQTMLEDAYEDSDYNFTRPEVLFQFLATLVFPNTQAGLPEVEGDITYRQFLKRMVGLLLQGSKKTTLIGGVEALTDAEVGIIQASDFIGKPGVGWTLADQFLFEVTVSKTRRTTDTSAMSVAAHYHTLSIDINGNGSTTSSVYDSGSGPSHTHTVSDFAVSEAAGTGQAEHTHDLLSDFPDLPVVLQSNVALVMNALDPAHTLYNYKNLFREVFKKFTDSVTSWSMGGYYYDDMRHNWGGVGSITGTAGMISPDGYTFFDQTRGFNSIKPWSTLTIPTSPTPSPTSHIPRERSYKVRQILTFPYGDDPTARPYFTSPSGLSGSATVTNGAFVDPSQDFSMAVVDETLTMVSGPNAGTYILYTLLGLGGGPVGSSPGPATSVVPYASFLKVTPRLVGPTSGITYSVEVDRLGKKVPNDVTEDVSPQFFDGPGPYSNILVSNGPLVKNWGDSTPADINDVLVRYDSAPQQVSSINPYNGTITLLTPIPGFAPGSHTVTVSYFWMDTPTFGLMGLNNPGLVLNQWDKPSGRGATSAATTEIGGYRTARFSMRTVLGVQPKTDEPLSIAYRFLAFDKGYSAVLNSPSTLLLNQIPGSVSVPYAEQEVNNQSVDYEATAIPADPWVKVGIVSSSVYQNSYYMAANGLGYWKQDLPLVANPTISMAARLMVGTPLHPDGIFTGVGFGFHNNQRLYFAGALSVTNAFTGSPLRHIGILIRPGELSDHNSWLIGPQAPGVIQANVGAPVNVVIAPTSSLPTLIGTGNKFQITDGGQTGVYTITDVYHESGNTTMVVTPPFPADPSLLGNKYCTLYFDVPWDVGFSTWRLYVNTRSQSVQLLFGGSSGSSVSISTQTVASPAYLGPDVLPEGYGRALFGSVSRIANSTSYWDFIRAQSTPDGSYLFSRGTIIDTTMSVDPEDAEWYVTTPFGNSSVLSNILSLNSTPAEPGLGTSYGFSYTDIFLNGRRVVALDANLEVLRDTAGNGGGTLLLRDTVKEVRLGTITYQDNGPLGKAIFRSDTMSIVGSTPYYSQGWSEYSGLTFGNTPSIFPNGHEYLMNNQTLPWGIFQTLPIVYSTGAGRFLEFRLAIKSATSGGDGRIGFSILSKGLGVQVCVDFVSNGIAIRNNPVAGAIAIIGAPWGTGKPITYTVIYNIVANNVSVLIDGVVGDVIPLADFLAPDGFLEGDVGITSLSTSSSSFSISMESLCFGNTEENIPNLNRTFGLFSGGDSTNIDNWVIPRTDSTGQPNSSSSSVITTMDWTTMCWVRVLLDPTFGASFIRPDLNPPPGYAGDFATDSMNPSAGWVNIEYGKLPIVSSAESFGTVSFGALNPAGSVVSNWGEVRYRVFTNTSIDYVAPQNMVLNQYSVVSSGDYLLDTTPQEVFVSSVSSNVVSLLPCGIYANRVFAVRVDNITLLPTSYTFNAETQAITLVNPLPEPIYPVNIVFAAGMPITDAYVKSLPAWESQTVLNDKTPPVPMSQVGSYTLETVSGDGGPTPDFPPATPSDPNYFLRDQYLVRVSINDPNALYNQIEFFQETVGGVPGLLTNFDDGFVPHEVVFLAEENWVPALPAPGSYRNVLYASGGAAGVLGLMGPVVYTAPYVGPNPTPTGNTPYMITPNYPSEGVVPGSDSGAINREVRMVLAPV